MVSNHIPAVFGTLVAFAALIAVPAHAADEVDAKLQVCSSCHGANGVPINATIPIIWGQQEYFLVKQLHDYRSGDRENPIMAAFAKPLTQADLRPAARYFASKTWPARSTPAASTSPPDGMAVCQICHQQNFVGGLPAPRLAGQSYEYLVEAMRRFAEGERTNNAEMTQVMATISSAEREAIARYIAGL